MTRIDSFYQIMEEYNMVKREESLTRQTQELSDRCGEKILSYFEHERDPKGFLFTFMDDERKRLKSVTIYPTENKHGEVNRLDRFAIRFSLKKNWDYIFFCKEKIIARCDFFFQNEYYSVNKAYFSEKMSKEIYKTAYQKYLVLSDIEKSEKKQFIESLVDKYLSK